MPWLPWSRPAASRNWARRCPARNRARAGRDTAPHRSEEHTSELQSQSNLVCRLLLEKKKKKPIYFTVYSQPSAEGWFVFHCLPMRNDTLSSVMYQILQLSDSQSDGMSARSTMSYGV